MGHNSAPSSSLPSSLLSSSGRSLLVVTVWCRPVIRTGPEPAIRQKVMGGWSWKSSTLNIGWQDDLRLATGTLISSWSWFCTMASTTWFSQWGRAWSKPAGALYHPLLPWSWKSRCGPRAHSQKQSVVTGPGLRDPRLPRPPNPDPTLLTQKHQGSSSANGLAARAVFLNYCLVQIYVQSGISGAYEVLFLVFWGISTLFFS